LVSELEVRVDRHAPSPHVDVIVRGQGDRVIVAACDVLNEAFGIVLEGHERRLLNPYHLLILDAELAMLVITPRKHLSICSKNTSEERPAKHFGDGQLEVDLIR
jgi:hypothetical protein